MDLLKRTKKFIDEKWDRKSPLLLGYSGGPDSKALLYALRQAGISPHLAHVDHGWRSESAEEAAQLEEEAGRLGLPFHLKKLEGSPIGNLEEWSRNERLKFFKSLFEQFPFQALLLGHQADDQAETVLKRVLEGAHLVSFSAMSGESELAGMRVWRPLLGTTKKEILELDLQPILDPTNRDQKFLRGRLREQILPDLARQFGKEIGGNLRLLAERAGELGEYLDRKVAMVNREEGPWGVYYDLTGLERIEARHFLQKIGSFSREELEMALDVLGEKKANMQCNGLYIDRGMVFVLKDPPHFEQAIELRAGRFQSGDWTVEIEEGKAGSSDWKQVWSGRFEMGLPDGVLEMPGTFDSLRHDWNEAKVPAFIRGQVPVLNTGTKRIEFLSGKRYNFEACRWKVRFYANARCLKSVSYACSRTI